MAFDRSHLPMIKMCYDADNADDATNHGTVYGKYCEGFIWCRSDPCLESEQNF